MWLIIFTENTTMKGKLQKKVHDPNEYHSLRFHPYNIALTLGLFSITMLFFAFSAAYVYTRVQFPEIAPISLSPVFFFNTMVLLASSWAINWANRAYLEDNTTDYQRALKVTIVLTIIFMVGQFIGWNDLSSQLDSQFLASNLSSYLYLISALHFAHLLAGLPFLLLFYYVAEKRMKEPVSVLVYFSDPEKQLKLNLLTTYWHYLDVLWIYLILFFLVNSFISF
jgi:cytochrome c oxidase subunit 3